MNHDGDDHDNGIGYGRFLAMIATSTAVMLALMYFNTYAWEHILWSETRFYMALVMGAAMAVIMLWFMKAMYSDPKKNAAIFIGSVVVFAGALWLVRSQQTIDDVAFMKAMIPHHSIAVMTSERAHIRDPRTRALARDIITAQRREIAEMKYLIADIEENGIRPASNGRGSDPPAPADTLTDGAPSGSMASGASDSGHERGGAMTRQPHGQRGEVHRRRRSLAPDIRGGRPPSVPGLRHGPGHRGGGPEGALRAVLAVRNDLPRIGWWHGPRPYHLPSLREAARWRAERGEHTR